MTQPTTEAVGDDIRIERTHGLTHITLTRPRAINSLTTQMLDAVQQGTAGADRVEIRGEGERGFCAGADVRLLREIAMDDPHAAGDWLEHEYVVDAAVAALPGETHLHGISMGGGLGMSIRQHVSARDDLVLAMPEVGIGLWPDVGMTFELSRAPRLVGRHLAMTGASIDAPSALWAGLVDEVVDAQERPVQVDASASQLARDSSWIQECYDCADPLEVVSRLQQHPDSRAHEAAQLIATRCPLSVVVALEAVLRAEEATSLAQVLATDTALGHAFTADSDFAEGVRAQLVDKDRTPHWSHASLADVPRRRVEQMFDGV